MPELPSTVSAPKIRIIALFHAMARTTRTVERHCRQLSNVSPLHLLQVLLRHFTFLSTCATTPTVDVTREFSPKAIPKKKIKGNEENVWREMRVLQGLDHLNIVRPIFPRALPTSHLPQYAHTHVFAPDPFFSPFL